jgi:hypothetical protein
VPREDGGLGVHSKSTDNRTMRCLVPLVRACLLFFAAFCPEVLAQPEAVKQPTQPDPIELLSHWREDVRWKRDSLLLGNVTLDRETDAVVLGLKGEAVFVGIVAGPFRSSSRHWVLEFPAKSQSEGGLCGEAKDARLQLEKLSVPEDAPRTCDSSEVARECRRWRESAQLLYLATARGSKGIKLADTKCDSFHIYFDPVERKPVWWRY